MGCRARSGHKRRKQGRVRENPRDGPGTEKGSEAWLARRGSSQEEHTVNSLGWAERHGNRAGVADSLAWREGVLKPERESAETRHKLVRGQLGLAQGGGQGQDQSTGARTAWLGARG